jgi:glycerol-3-phosphate dehydrogenase (NAD(P)+)
MKLSIIGSGNWGTTLAILLSENFDEVYLYSKEGFNIFKERENIKYLPGFKIPQEVTISDNLKECAGNADVVIFAVPSHYLQEAVHEVKKYYKESVIVSATKGIEEDTLLRPSQVIEQGMENIKLPLVVMSGPNIAREIAMGIPASTVCASKDEKLAHRVQLLFGTSIFRTYRSLDVIGVELGGALKNIIAIACGISDGLGFGTNAKGSLVTRGLAEITRLGVKMGASPLTFSGLSGLGDLVTTAMSKNSRNRFVGEEIGKGRKLNDILSSMVMVAEGISTTRSAVRLSQKWDVDLPITKEVYEVLFLSKSPEDGIRSLMKRDLKPEIWGIYEK